MKYLSPRSLDELFSLMRAHGPHARLLAGGTDLLVRVNKDSDAPLVVIDLKRVAALRSDVLETRAGISIGARAVMTDLVENHRVRQHFPALVESALVVGSVQIRNRATLGGNICNASPAADTAPALLAYGASVNIASANGSRRVPLDTFFTGPGSTVLSSGEILESIDLPFPPEPAASAFGRLTRRHGVDLAIVSVCCVAHESGRVRFAFGAVGPRPFVVDATVDAPLDEVVAHANPISDLRASAEYRRAMLPVLARRTLNAATARIGACRADLSAVAPAGAEAEAAERRRREERV
jgi:carbon-monoxide dehydrogenase medium subunit